jgi:sugar/nucleoside kinase (ribokinase family)
MPDFDLLVIGDLNPDLVLTDADVVPEFGQKEKLVADAALEMGGSSAICAVQAAKLGLRTTFVGKVGDDGFGHLMRGELQKNGVDTSLMIVDPGIKTGLTVNLNTGDDRAMLTYLGSISALQPEDLPAGHCSRTRHVHVGSFFLQTGLQSGLAAFFQQARAQGVTVSLDTGWDAEERWNGPLTAALAQVDVFLPNENELCAIARVADPLAALEQLAAQIPVIAMKQGPAGATARRSAEVAQCAPPAVQVVDAVGAGDSFDAGFLYGFLHGWPLAECVRLGCYCGAWSTRWSGGIAGQPTRAELAGWFEF